MHGYLVFRSPFLELASWKWPHGGDDGKTLTVDEGV